MRAIYPPMLWPLSMPLFIFFFIFSPPGAWAQAQQQEVQQQKTEKTFKQEELDQLLAPIALYPDALVAQILMASTYPLEVVEAARWSKDNPNVMDKALEEAMQKQSWDPSVKSLTAFPQVLEMMDAKLDWTQKLGDAFLAQQQQVMRTVQTLRKKAQDAGNLKTSKEQKVTTEQNGDQTIIIIEPADPQVVYVPTYNPTVVYGAWPYPAYPPYYYYPPGYVAGTAFFSFSVGVIVGSAMWGGCNWNHSNVYVNVNHYNNFNRTNINNPNWEHNIDHRKGVAYRDTRVQERYGQGRAKDSEARESYRGRTEQGGLGRDQRPDRPAQSDRGNLGGSGSTQGFDADRSRASEARQGAAFEGLGQGSDVRNYSNRGAASRGGMSRGGGARGGGGRR